MKYKFDSDLIPLASTFDVFDLTSPDVTRNKLLEASKNKEKPDSTGVHIEDRTIVGPIDNPNLRIRLYYPDNAGNGDIPVILNIHGGGFVIGRIEIDDESCIQISRETGALVVSVGYRLSPEHPYPAALNDCYAALEWIRKVPHEYRIDTAKIIVHGVSAGGGLAAALCLLNRDNKDQDIYFQYLDLPELDDRLSSPSMMKFTDTPGWNTPNAKLSWKYYLGALYENVDTPIYAAPNRAIDLSGLPPAFIGVFEYDPLRSEAVEYSEKLFNSNVSVELHVYSGAYHLAYLVPTAQVTARRNQEKINTFKRILNK